jgi:hypothetical protein
MSKQSEGDLSEYGNLFLKAQIPSSDHARFAKLIDTLRSRENIPTSDIVGVGDEGTRSNTDLYVVTRSAVYLLRESGIFKKTQSVVAQWLVAEIAYLKTAQEGWKGSEPTIIAEKPNGDTLFKIKWGLGGPDPEYIERVVTRQITQLFQVISSAMDLSTEQPQPKGDQTRCPCGAGSLTVDHMNAHVVDLKLTHDIDALTYDCPICGYVEGELWHHTDEGRSGAPAGLLVHLVKFHDF